MRRAKDLLRDFECDLPVDAFASKTSASSRGDRHGPQRRRGVRFRKRVRSSFRKVSTVFCLSGVTACSGPSSGTSRSMNEGDARSDRSILEGGLTRQDSAADAEGRASCGPPELSDAGRCGLVFYYLRVLSATVWVADSTATGGGRRVTLGSAGSVTAGGHTYAASTRFQSWFLTSGFQTNIAVDVDASQTVAFGASCCATASGPTSYDCPGSLSVSYPTCTGCNNWLDTGRHYSVERLPKAPDASNADEYRVVADAPPRDCGTGFDLLEFTVGN